MLLVKQPRLDAGQLPFRLRVADAIGGTDPQPGESRQEVGKVEPILDVLGRLVVFDYPNNRREVWHIVVDLPHPPHDIFQRHQRRAAQRPAVQGRRHDRIANEPLPPHLIIQFGRELHAESVANPLDVLLRVAQELPRPDAQAPLAS